MDILGTPVSVGGGRKKISHGWVAIPAPATVNILEGYPIRYGPVDEELATPTGAALLRELVSTPLDTQAFRCERIGLGAGSLDLPGISNILRVVLGEVAFTPHNRGKTSWPSLPAIVWSVSIIPERLPPPCFAPTPAVNSAPIISTRP